MATRAKSTLLVQGKERRIDGGRQSWRVRLYATADGYQVMFKAPAGEGEPVEASAPSRSDRVRGPPDLRPSRDAPRH